MLPSLRIKDLTQGSDPVVDNCMSIAGIVKYLDEQYLSKHPSQKTRVSLPPKESILAVLTKHTQLPYYKLLQKCWRLGKTDTIITLLFELEKEGRIESWVDTDGRKPARMFRIAGIS